MAPTEGFQYEASTVDKRVRAVLPAGSAEQQSRFGQFLKDFKSGTRDMPVTVARLVAIDINIYQTGTIPGPIGIDELRAIIGQDAYMSPVYATASACNDYVEEARTLYTPARIVSPSIIVVFILKWPSPLT